MPDLDLGVIIRTLLISGFDLERVGRDPGQLTIDVYRYDAFGTKVPYSIAFFDNDLATAALKAFEKRAEYERRIPLLVGPGATHPSLAHLTLESFFEKLGGPVDNLLVTSKDLPERLEELGFNRVPTGLDGKAEDLLEDATKSCLQYLLMQRARRWGSERRFESLPDGIATGKNGLILLYDSKAYSNGYEVSADDIRRYADYVETFHKKYLASIGRIHSVLLISANFPQEEKSLRERSAELYAKTGVALSFVKARTLGEMVQIILREPHLRPSIDWKRILAQPLIASSMLDEQISALNAIALLINVKWERRLIILPRILSHGAQCKLAIESQAFRLNA